MKEFDGENQERFENNQSMEMEQKEQREIQDLIDKSWRIGRRKNSIRKKYRILDILLKDKSEDIFI